MLADEEYTRQKDKRKKRRAILQGLVLVTLLGICIDALFVFSRYRPYRPDQVKGVDRGFVALSYFGVDRTGTHDLIGTRLLDEHLTALEKNGFVTITGKDVEEYYRSGRTLPEHALLLNFEDGRRDTAVFAEKLLEKHNYHGVVSTYADNLKGGGQQISPAGGTEGPDRPRLLGTGYQRVSAVLHQCVRPVGPLPGQHESGGLCPSDPGAGPEIQPLSDGLHPG